MDETLGVEAETIGPGLLATMPEDVRPWAWRRFALCDVFMEHNTLQTPMDRGLSGAVIIDDGQLGQLAYHIRWSAALAADGESANAALHAIIADALLDILGGQPLRAASSALDLPDVVAKPPSEAALAQRAAAMELSYQFVSHFTSDGRHDLADLYLETTRRIGHIT
jgi:hypothetical protein